MSAPPLTPAYRDAPRILLAGDRRTHRFATRLETIPQQWRDFMASDLPEIHNASATYGVILQNGTENDEMDYMCAVEMHAVEEPATKLERLTLSRAVYAVFTVEGVAGVRDAWPRLYREWLPASGQQLAEAPPFERYDDRFQPDGSGPVEIWLPLKQESPGDPA